MQQDLVNLTFGCSPSGAAQRGKLLPEAALALSGDSRPALLPFFALPRPLAEAPPFADLPDFLGPACWSPAHTRDNLYEGHTCICNASTATCTQHISGNVSRMSTQREVQSLLLQACAHITEIHHVWPGSQLHQHAQPIWYADAAAFPSGQIAMSLKR